MNVISCDKRFDQMFECSSAGRDSKIPRINSEREFTNGLLDIYLIESYEYRDDNECKPDTTNSLNSDRSKPINFIFYPPVYNEYGFNVL